MKRENRFDAASLCEGIELHPARIMNMISAVRFGRSVMLCEEVDSTNRIAADAAAGGAPEGAVCVALSQYSGRGRKGREWISTEEGSLVFSIVLRPSQTPESLTTLLGLAAAQTIDELSPGMETGIKWPNDIYISGLKVAGILAESKGDNAVIGIGIDVNETEDDFPDELKDTAVSLRIASGRRFDRGRLLASIIDRFEILYTRWEREGLSVFKYDIEEKLLWKGMKALIETGGGEFSGIISGITAEGYLRIESGAEEHIFRAGDLSLKVEER